MISMLKGIVESVAGQSVTIDVNGVGYDVISSSRCLEKLIPGEAAKIVVYTDVKQDSIRLYGFLDQMERQVFLLLIQVQGVGCKSAADIVSRIDSRELLRAIGEGDVDRLQTIKGIGKKTSQRIVVELKDKVAEFAIERQSNQPSSMPKGDAAVEDAMQALQALGFLRKDAERAVQAALAQAGSDLHDSGLIVKAALRFV